MADSKANFLSKFLRTKKLHSIEFITIWTHYDRVELSMCSMFAPPEASLKDGSGYLDRRELDNFITDLLKERTGQEAVTEDMIVEVRDNVLAALDSNKDGRIELGEFAKLLPLEDNFMKKFETRKTDGNGYIEGKELMALIHDIMNKGSKKVSLKEVQDYRDAAMSVFDKNTDGRLSRKELGLLLSVDK